MASPNPQAGTANGAKPGHFWTAWESDCRARNADPAAMAAEVGRALSKRLDKLSSAMTLKGGSGIATLSGTLRGVARVIAKMEKTIETRLAAIEARLDAVETAAAPCRAMGLYSATESYREGDFVAKDGSLWLAKKDDPGPLPGDGWMLAARPGKPGRTGDRGPPGANGTGLTDIRAEGTKLHITLSSGEVARIDIAPLVEAALAKAGANHAPMIS